MAEEIAKDHAIPIFFVTGKGREFWSRFLSTDFPISHYLDKNDLQTKPEEIRARILEGCEAFDYSVRKLSTIGKLVFRDRPIGIRVRSGLYKFFHKDEVLYFRSYNGCTEVHLADGSVCMIGRHLKPIEEQIIPIYPHFLRLSGGKGQGTFLVNLEKIASLEGQTLTFDNRSSIALSDVGRRKLSREILTLQTRPSPEEK